MRQREQLNSIVRPRALFCTIVSFHLHRWFFVHFNSFLSISKYVMSHICISMVTCHLPLREKEFKEGNIGFPVIFGNRVKNVGIWWKLRVLLVSPRDCERTTETLRLTENPWEFGRAINGNHRHGNWMPHTFTKQRPHLFSPWQLI